MPSEQTIDALQLEISVNSSAAEKDLTRLLSTLRSINAVGNRSTGLAKINRQLAEMASISFGSFKDELHSIREDLEAIASIKGINLKNIRSQISKITPKPQINVKPEILPKSGATGDRPAEPLIGATDIWKPQEIDDVSEKLKNLAVNTASLQKGYANLFNTIRNSKSSYPEHIFDNVSEEVNKNLLSIARLNEIFEQNGELTDEQKQQYIELKDQFSQLSASFATIRAENDKLNQSFKQIKPPVNGATTSLKKFWSSVKRIALYRTIRRVLQLIANAFKEGISNIYQYDKAYNGIFSQSMDRLATSGQYWKNSLGAALAPIIVMITPMVENLAEAFANLNNTIGQVFAALAGQSTYIKANSDAIKKYAETAKKALVGFDEINTLSNANKNYEEMFSTEEISDGLKFLQVVGAWLRENKELVKQVLVAFATVAAMNWAQEKAYLTSYITQLMRAKTGTNALTNAFYNKNNALNQQSQATATDLAAVVALAGGFALAASKAGDLSDVISGWDSSKMENAFGNMTDVIGSLNSEIEDLRTQLDSLPSEVEAVKSSGISTLPATSGGSNVISTLPATGGGSHVVSTLPAITSGGTSSLPAVSSGGSTATTPVVTETPATEVKKASFWDGLKAVGSILWNGSTAGKAVNAVGDVISDIGKGISNGSSGNDLSLGIGSGIAIGGGTALSLLPILSFFADGAYGVPAGQLFVAREAGAEMVGSIGHKTAVANNDQIVEAIKQGVIEAMESSSQGGDWTINIVDDDGNIKASQVIKAAQRKNRRDGKTVIQLGV